MLTLSSSTFFLLLLLPSATQTRKLLQDPFFPAAQPPLPANSPATPLTKYPFSLTPPFFPQFPSSSPPPPFSSSNQPTFPANISSLVFPNSPSSSSSSSSHHHSSSKLATFILLPLFSFFILSLLIIFLIRHHKKPNFPLPEKTQLFPPNFSSSSSSEANGSPELHPLPPLTRQAHNNNGEGRNWESLSSEEFYSPRNSSLGRVSSSQKEFGHVAMDTCGSENNTLSTTPSYPSSSSRSSSGGFKEKAMTSPMISDLESIEVVVCLDKEKISSFENVVECGERNGVVGDKDLNVMAAIPPPPPPPPPPPHAGYWESKIRGSGLNNPASSLIEPSNLEKEEKYEETGRPKLKPLHWDKVRASSDRAMVWDHLKSSSFQYEFQLF